MPTFNTYFPNSLHGWDIINVKSSPYNAVGDGSTDDTVALQTAFDVAWGTRLDPKGQGPDKFTNKAVYLPPGDYKTTAALYITGAQGAKMFGDSAECTIISHVNPMAGNLWRPAGSGAGDEVCPLLCMNGNAFFTMEGISLRQLSPLVAPANFGSCAIWVINAMHTGGGIATVPVYRNMKISGFQHGVFVGYGEGPGGGGNSENGTLYNVQFENCTASCLLCFHQNVLNWNVFGGGCTNCAHDSTGPTGNGFACYRGPGGAISTVAGVKMINNGWDFNNGGGAPMSVIGGYSTSLQSVAAPSGTFVSGFTFRPPTSYNVNPLFCQSELTVSGCVFDPELDNGPGNICSGTGQITIDGLHIGPGGASSSFSGNAALWVRGVRPVGSQNLFATFTGKVMDYTPEDPTPYAYMPHHSKFRGLTRVINDSPATSGLITTGGGVNVVFAYCEGSTGWRIIGPAVL